MFLTYNVLPAFGGIIKLAYAKVNDILKLEWLSFYSYK